jgi:hypothetical protein
MILATDFATLLKPMESRPNKNSITSDPRNKTSSNRGYNRMLQTGISMNTLEPFYLVARSGLHELSMVLYSFTLSRLQLYG